MSYDKFECPECDKSISIYTKKCGCGWENIQKNNLTKKLYVVPRFTDIDIQNEEKKIIEEIKNMGLTNSQWFSLRFGKKNEEIDKKSNNSFIKNLINEESPLNALRKLNEQTKNIKEFL